MCQVPPPPQAPTIDAQICGDAVCITVEEAKALVQYKHDVDEMNAALGRCSLIQVVTK